MRMVGGGHAVFVPVGHMDGKWYEGLRMKAATDVVGYTKKNHTVSGKSGQDG